jgi:hypothetical protein
MTHCRIALGVIALSLAACSESRSPTSPTSNARTQGIVGLTAYIYDTAFRPLAGVRVEALDGQSAGMSAQTDVHGNASLQGYFTAETRFRATLEGHETLMKAWTCAASTCPGRARPYLYFTMRPLATPLDLAGEYLVTMAAAPSCTNLAPELRSRTYSASITPYHALDSVDVLGYFVDIHSPTVPEPWHSQYIGVAGNYMAIWITDGDGDLPGLVEEIGLNHYVAYTGLVSATLPGPRPGNFTAAFESFVDDVVVAAPLTTRLFSLNQEISQQRCASQDHQVIFERR